MAVLEFSCHEDHQHQKVCIATEHVASIERRLSLKLTLHLSCFKRQVAKYP